MKYSLWNFRDWFEQNNISLSYRISDNTASIEEVTLSKELYKANPGQAVVTSGSLLSNCSGFRSALCFQNDQLLFPVTSPETVFNLANDMIEYYNNWESDLLEAIVSGISVPNLLNLICKVFPLPLALLYINGNYHTSSEWNTDLLPETQMRLLDGIRSQDTAQPIYYLSGMQGDTLIARPVFKKKASGPLLVFYDKYANLKSGDLQIFIFAAEIVGSAIRFQTEKKAAVHPLSKWYANQISSDTFPRSETACTEILPQVGWLENDLYLIASIHSDHLSGLQSSALISAFTGKHFCKTNTTNGFSVLIHLKNAESSIPAVESFLSDICRKFPVRIGISLTFRGLNAVSDYYQQSLMAISEIPPSESGLSRTIDHLPKYLLTKCRSLPDVQTFIHPDIQFLQQSDATEHSHLIDVLYAYLIHGRSVATAADDLQIHRNTFRQYLSRIRKLISLPIDDESETERILISLIIAGKKSRES